MTIRTMRGDTAVPHLPRLIVATLIPVLERKAGRVLVNGWPTGVEVTHAMVHGGPFPATSDSRSTSVGSLAIDRFLRPVCYQDVPEALLPADLRDDTTLTLSPRRRSRAGPMTGGIGASGRLPHLPASIPS